MEPQIHHDYEAAVEVRSLLSAERLEDIDGRLAVTDEDSHGIRYVEFWVDDAPSSPTESRSPVGGEAPSRVSLHHIGTPLFPNLSARETSRAPASQKEGIDHRLINQVRIGVMAMEALTLVEE